MGKVKKVRTKRLPYTGTDARFYNRSLPGNDNDFDPTLAPLSNYYGGRSSDFKPSDIGQSSFFFEGQMFQCVESAFHFYKSFGRPEDGASELAEFIRVVGRSSVIIALGKATHTFGLTCSKKCYTPEEYEYILKMLCISQRIGLPLDWEDNKIGLMSRLVRAKFDQNPKLRRLLVSTDQRMIIEASQSDLFWGGGGLAGGGLNHLGTILMDIRSEFNKI